MSLPGVLLFSNYVENLWSPAMVVDWSAMPMTLVLPAAVLLVLMAVLAAGALFAINRAHPRLPGPIAFPVIGTKWIFFTRYRMNKLHEAYEDMFRRYGPVFAERSPFGTSMVSVMDREALTALLFAPARLPYRPPTEIVQVYRRSKPQLYASAGLVNEQGDTWHHLRRNLTAELTSPCTMRGFVPELNKIADDFMELLDKCRRQDGTVRAFDSLTNRMGLESVCALMLGTRLGFLERCMSGRAAALAAAVKTHFRAQRDSYYGVVSMWKYAATKLYRRFEASEVTIHRIVSDLMEEAKSRKEHSAQDDGMQEIFLKILSNQQLDERDKKTAIIDFITAGIETLANSLVFLLYLLGKRPDWQARIRQELPERGEVGLDELAAAPAVRAAVKEAFRLLPTAPFLARVLQEPLVVAEKKLRAGTFVLAHTAVACRQEDNFVRAREYLPERWVQDMKPHSPKLVSPFGRGRRMCPGKRFVELQLHLLLAKIMQRYSVQFDGDLDIQFDFLMSPRSPVTVRLSRALHVPRIVVHSPTPQRTILP